LPNYKFHWCPEGRPCTLLTRISGRVRFPLLLLRTPAQLSLEKLSTSAKNSLIAPWDGFVEGVSVKQGAEAACAYSTLGSSSVGFLSLVPSTRPLGWDEPFTFCSRRCDDFAHLFRFLFPLA